MKKQKWLQTGAAWVWSDPMPETNIPIRYRNGNYKLFQMVVDRTEYPSNKAIATMHLYLGGGSGSAFDREDCKIFDARMLDVIPGSRFNDRSLLGVRSVTFDLPSGKEFCDVAVETAQALFRAFGINDTDNKFIGEMVLGQVTFVKKGAEWVHLSTHILDKHGLVEAGFTPHKSRDRRRTGKQGDTKPLLEALDLCLGRNILISLFANKEARQILDFSGTLKGFRIVRDPRPHVANRILIIDTDNLEGSVSTYKEVVFTPEKTPWTPCNEVLKWNIPEDSLVKEVMNGIPGWEYQLNRREGRFYFFSPGETVMHDTYGWFITGGVPHHPDLKANAAYTMKIGLS